jgi:transposase
MATNGEYAAIVRRLGCLRGVSTLTAFGLAVEVGDWHRFTGATIGAYLGLVPTESSSGQQRSQGSITKAGNTHARRLLVEAAWHYLRPPRVGQTLRNRQDGQPAEILQIAWRAQQRLYRTHTRLRQRGKHGNTATVAAARELAGFIWAAAIS